MQNILIAAKNEQVCENISAFLTELDCRIVTATDGIRVRSMDTGLFDIIILSTPLSDEFGLDLAAELHGKAAAGLIVLTKGEIADEVQNRIKFTGALVIGRPFNKSALLQAIRFAGVAGENIRRLENEKDKLTKQLEDVKLIHRAKVCLMQYLKLTEEQAHRHLQKQAMDLRKTQRQVAEDVLKTYSKDFPNGSGDST